MHEGFAESRRKGIYRSSVLHWTLHHLLSLLSFNQGIYISGIFGGHFAAVAGNASADAWCLDENLDGLISLLLYSFLKWLYTGCRRCRVFEPIFLVLANCPEPPSMRKGKYTCGQDAPKEPQRLLHIGLLGGRRGCLGTIWPHFCRLLSNKQMTLKAWAQLLVNFPKG